MGCPQTPQYEFPEPRIRINTDTADGNALNWNELNAWDDMAAYYSQAMKSGL